MPEQAHGPRFPSPGIPGEAFSADAGIDWRRYPLQNFSLTLRVTEDFTSLPVEAQLAVFSWRMARLEEMGRLTLPDGWREGLREELYYRLAVSRIPWLRTFSARMSHRRPVRRKTWEAQALVPGMHVNPLPDGRDAIRIAVFTPGRRAAA